MTSRRSRRKDKKRNDRLRDEAWEAVSRGRWDRARRLLNDAVARAPGNARYWHDLGAVERRAGRPEAAERALQRALTLSDDYGEALAELAALRAAARDFVAAVELGERALSRLQDADEFAAELARWRREVPAIATFGAAVSPGASEDGESRELEDGERTARYDWETVGEELHRDGLAALPGLVEPRAATTYATALGAELRARLQPILAAWSTRMGREDDETPGPEDAAGAFEATGLEAVVTVGDEAARVTITDVRPGRARTHEVLLAPGDVALVCARRRPVRVGGVWGWQPVTCEEPPGALLVALVPTPD